jgi:hypothetical protein
MLLQTAAVMRVMKAQRGLSLLVQLAPKVLGKTEVQLPPLMLVWVLE